MRLIDADKLIEFIDTFLSKTCKRDGTTIPNRWYGALKRCVEEQPTVNAVVIPDNATNGDVIKVLYPNRTFFNEDSCCVTMKEYGKTEEDAEYLTYIDFDGDWWNAPYRVEKESKE